MISVIVLGSESRRRDDDERVHEIVVRSLVWLVSATVAGVVRDVILALPPRLGLSEVADQSGCGLVESADEAGRLAAAIAAARSPRLLVLEAGYQPDAGVVEEIDAIVRRAPAEATALLLAAPETSLQRLFPKLAPAIGVLAPRAFCAELASPTLERLVRAVRGAGRLRGRAVRIN